MDELLNLFQTIFEVHNPKMHPLVNCYNPVKCSLLVYEICWKIQKKKAEPFYVSLSSSVAEGSDQ